MDGSGGCALLLRSDKIRTFYNALNVLDKSPNYDYAVINWGGKPVVIDSDLIVEITGLPTGEGFCDMQKKSGPTSDYCIRKRMLEPSNCKQLKISQLNFCDKLLHQIIIHNVTPRIDDRDTCNNCDQAIMGHVLAGETMDTPRIILRHLLLAK